MACERWCFNDGCDAAVSRWVYVLLLAVYTIGYTTAVVETDPSHYSYSSLQDARSLADYRWSSIVFVPEGSNVIRKRRSTEQTLITTEQPQEHSLSAQQQPQQQQPQQQQQQKPPQQQPNPVVSTTNTSVDVSYSTGNGTNEDHEQTTTTVTVTEATSGKPEVLKLEKKNGAKASDPIKPPSGPAVGTIWPNHTMSTDTTKLTEDKNGTKRVESSPSSSDEANNQKDKSDGQDGDITISKSSDGTNETVSQDNTTKTEYDTHKYYNSTFIVGEAVGRKYWVDLTNHPALKVDPVLSQSHRRAATVKLSFDFPFYGHKVRNITIATGGFLYTGEFVHSWLAATQYIAPLMANFDTRLSDQSHVKYADNGTAFTVEWEKVVLQDKPKAGAFTFQATLHRNGDIVFVYSVIPFVVEQIQDTSHPVKIGLSDAYMMDRTVFFVRRKTIYEYHRVNFDRQDIRNWTVIYLHALPTCLDMDNCRDCLSKSLADFECKWCPEFNRCSTGLFRWRQDWLLKGCDRKNINNIANCPPATTMYKEHEEGYDHEGHVHTEETVTVSQSNVQKERPGASSLENSRTNMNMSVSGIIGILLVVVLVGGLMAWGVYAYRNPHSASGQMLIRYRPSQWSWRRGEARYTAATIHM